MHRPRASNNAGIQALLSPPALSAPSKSIFRPRAAPDAPPAPSGDRCLPVTTTGETCYQQTNTRIHCATASWRRWVRSCSTLSTGSRTWFSTPLEMTPSTCPRLYVVLLGCLSAARAEYPRWIGGSGLGAPCYTCTAVLTLSGCCRVTIVRKVICNREHRWQRLSPPRQRYRYSTTSHSPAHQHPERAR